jgi:solute carrier family 41
MSKSHTNKFKAFKRITPDREVIIKNVASFLLAAVMMVVIILSQKLSINPDNIATPIAASLGDLVTLSILATVGTLLYQIS